MRPVLFLALLLLAAPVTARPFHDRQPGASEQTSLEEAVAQVRQQTGGRVLSAETRSVEGRRVHRIKVLLSDGRIRVLLIEAER
ncbi:MAG TPA: hypothetical protein EYP40_10260 [Chromatiales bacterium]|nr:hypothetical protein [Chromatiales bacterium]